MSTQPTPAKSRRRRGPSRLLSSGESVIASAGLAGAAVLLLGMGASAAWTMYSAHSQNVRAQADKTEALAEVLTSSVEGLLAEGGSISTVRTLVMSTALANDLKVCRLVVEGETRAGKPTRLVVADAEPRNLSSQALLAAWQMNPPTDDELATIEATDADWKDLPETANRIARTIKLPSGTRGLLLVADHGPQSVWAMWTVHTGIALIGAGALSIMLVAYRGTRSKLRAIGAIREALVSIENGGDSAQALLVAPDLGPEAGAWNRLLSERERLREASLLSRAGVGEDTPGGGRGSGADLLAACDAMWQGVLIVDETQRVTYVNGAAAVFLNTQRDTMTGQDIARFIDDPRVHKAVRSVASGTLKSRTTIESKRHAVESGAGEGTGGEGGGGVLRYSIRAVRRDEHAAALIVIEDVTQQRVADESRNAFVAQATHELRSPLTNIRLYVETLLESGGEDAVIRSKSLNVVNSEVRRLERIVGDMLSVAEIEAGSLSLKQDDVRLETLFPDLQAEFTPQAVEKEIGLAFVLPPKLPVIHGDRDKIVLAIHNLVGNAIKYTPAGGSVTVKVVVDREELRVEVADSGIGIKPEEQARVFDRFYRAQDRRINGITGSGLGLALAREVARLHGGDVTIRSEIDKGSTFTITLPVPAGAV